MKSVINKYIIVLILGFFIVISCVEEIDFVQTNGTFESALVIDATITDELKQQKILLSRTYAFEEEGPNPESNAQIQVLSGSEVIPFTETEPGIYLSEFEFSAQPSIDYQLLITTNNGKEYSSTKEQLTQVTQIDSLYAERITNDLGENGMAIYVDSFDPTGNSKYYRYTYEETYKIIAPKWTSKDAIVISDIWPYCEVGLVEKTEEKRVCYNTVISNKIIQTKTEGLMNNNINHFLVRFIDRENYILTWRYSILISQYVQTEEAYNYYKILSNISSQDNFFTQIQAGFFDGNIKSDYSFEEKVLGFFEVSSVSSQRIYFNWEDFFQNEVKPPYTSFCYEFAPVLNQGHPTDACGPLIDGIQSNEIVYFKINENPIPEFEGPFIMVSRECGDCTALGSNIVPDFWEE